MDLLWSYETYPEAFSDSINVPESENGTKDILDEIKVGLKFIRNMQASEGGFYQRLNGTGTQSFPTSYFEIESAEPTAVTADAYIVFKDIDSTYANACLTAAQNGWNYLDGRSQVNCTNGFVKDDNDSDNRLNAGAALYRATGNSTYDNSVKNYARKALNYILGINPMQESYILGYGENALTDVYSG